MAISSKRLPDTKDSDRVFNQIYDDINDIINSVNSEMQILNDFDGKPGDIRVIKDTSSKIATTKHKLEFKTTDGWEKTITMPRNPDGNAIIAYNEKTETFEWVNMDNVLEIIFGSPGVASLSTGVSAAQNTAGTSIGIEISDEIANGTIVVGSAGGDISKLKTQTMGGDATINADGDVSVNKLADSVEVGDGLYFPNTGTPASGSTHHIYRLGNDIKWENIKLNRQVMGSGNSYERGIVPDGNATHNDEFLRKDGTWQTTPGTGDTNEYSFKTLDIVADTFAWTSDDIVATTTTDTLKLVAGSNVTIQTDADDRALKISASSSAISISGTPATNQYARWTDASTLQGRSVGDLKSDLSLGNVEDTALSTWAGSTNITTLGSIATGTITGLTMTLGSDGEGDIYYRNASGALTRLGVGAVDTVLKSNGSIPIWGVAGAAGGLLGDLTDVNTGTAVPTSSDYTDAEFMPSIGSIYIRNTQTMPEIYWRTSDLVVAKWYGYGTYIKIDDDFIDATPLAPQATDINLYTNSSCTSSAPSYRKLGQGITLYAKATYNGGVSLPFDSNADPIATFSNPSGTRTMSGNNGDRTVSSFTADRTSDGTTTCGWTANGVQEGGVAVQDYAGSDAIYWRNNRIAGASSGTPTDANVSAPSYANLNQGYGYTNFTATVSVPAGGKAWFGMPSGYSASSVIINGENQLGAFSSTTRSYNNGSCTKTYKIYYTTAPQSAGSLTMDVN